MGFFNYKNINKMKITEKDIHEYLDSKKISYKEIKFTIYANTWNGKTFITIEYRDNFLQSTSKPASIEVRDSLNITFSEVAKKVRYKNKNLGKLFNLKDIAINKIKDIIVNSFKVNRNDIKGTDISFTKYGSIEFPFTRYSLRFSTVLKDNRVTIDDYSYYMSSETMVEYTTDFLNYYNIPLTAFKKENNER